MSKAKRGRPSKTTSKIRINDLDVEFISMKENNYNANICYFKITDPDCKNKMKAITCLADDDIRMPFWSTDNDDVMLKVKDKFVKQVLEMVTNQTYNINILFESYCIENDDSPPIKGYFAKILQSKKVQESTIEVVINENN